MPVALTHLLRCHHCEALGLYRFWLVIHELREGDYLTLMPGHANCSDGGELIPELSSDLLAEMTWEQLEGSAHERSSCFGQRQRQT